MRRIKHSSFPVKVALQQLGRLSGEAQELHALAITALTEGADLLEHASGYPIAQAQTNHLGDPASRLKEETRHTSLPISPVLEALATG